MGRIRFAWLALAAILTLAACQSVSEIDGVALSAEADTEVEALAVATPWKGWYDWFVIEFVWPAMAISPSGAAVRRPPTT